MTKVRLYRDESGYPRAEAEAPCQPLGWFLEQDVQGDADWGRELAAIIGEVRTGARDGYKGTGNAHTLVLSPTGGRIETEFAEPRQVCELSLNDLECAVRDWADFVRNDRG